MTDEHRSEHEKLLTMQAAAKALGLHYWAIQRAVRRGAIPSYRPFNSRPLVKLSDIQAAIEASKMGVRYEQRNLPGGRAEVLVARLEMRSHRAGFETAGEGTDELAGQSCRGP